jgi:hypothetical protein
VRELSLVVTANGTGPTAEITARYMATPATVIIVGPDMAPPGGMTPLGGPAAPPVAVQDLLDGGRLPVQHRQEPDARRSPSDLFDRSVGGVNIQELDIYP